MPIVPDRVTIMALHHSIWHQIIESAPQFGNAAVMTAIVVWMTRSQVAWQGTASEIQFYCTKQHHLGILSHLIVLSLKSNTCSSPVMSSIYLPTSATCSVQFSPILSTILSGLTPTSPACIFSIYLPTQDLCNLPCSVLFLVSVPTTFSLILMLFTWV